MEFKALELHSCQRVKFLQILARLGGEHFLHLENTDVRIIRRGKFLFIIKHGLLAGLMTNRLFHVRLAGTQPDFAHQNVGEGFRVTGFDDEGLRRERGLLFAELDQPLAVGGGAGGFTLAGKAHRDLGAWRRPTPNGNGHLLLQDHVVAKNGGKLQLRMSGELDGPEDAGQSQAKARGFRKQEWLHVPWLIRCFVVPVKHFRQFALRSIRTRTGKMSRTRHFTRYRKAGM